MEIHFLYDLPGVLAGKYLVVGDLHIGLEERIKEKGINFPNPHKVIAGLISKYFTMTSASRLILLGDIKESIGYPSKGEYVELQELFYDLRNMPISIVRGNHDAHLQEILERLGYDIEIKRALILDNMAFLHGNALPNEEALACSYIFEAHGHTALLHDGTEEKAFLIAKPAKKGIKAKLVLIPPINPIIAGNPISFSTAKHIPAFRSSLFDFYNAWVYTKSAKIKVKSVV
ncbi:MAG: metallophosphoesterase [Candidatus Micrarchaeia archaeon]